MNILKNSIIVAAIIILTTYVSAWGLMYWWMLQWVD